MDASEAAGAAEALNYIGYLCSADRVHSARASARSEQAFAQRARQVVKQCSRAFILAGSGFRLGGVARMPADLAHIRGLFDDLDRALGQGSDDEIANSAKAIILAIIGRLPEQDDQGQS